MQINSISFIASFTYHYESSILVFHCNETAQDMMSKHEIEYSDIFEH